jgi:hypothetical protein
MHIISANGSDYDCMNTRENKCEPRDESQIFIVSAQLKRNVETFI